MAADMKSKRPRRMLAWWLCVGGVGGGGVGGELLSPISARLSLVGGVARMLGGRQRGVGGWRKEGKGIYSKSLARGSGRYRMR